MLSKPTFIYPESSKKEIVKKISFRQIEFTSLRRFCYWNLALESVGAVIKYFVTRKYTRLFIYFLTLSIIYWKKIHRRLIDFCNEKIFCFIKIYYYLLVVSFVWNVQSERERERRETNIIEMKITHLTLCVSLARVRRYEEVGRREYTLTRESKREREREGEREASVCHSENYPGVLEALRAE